MSVYVLMFLGLAPLGNFETGFLTEHVGIPLTLSLNALILLIFGLLVFKFRNRIRTSYEKFKIQGSKFKV